MTPISLSKSESETVLSFRDEMKQFFPLVLEKRSEYRIYLEQRIVGCWINSNF